MNRLAHPRLIDPYIGLLLATVALASVLPARGWGADAAEAAAQAGVGLLFLLYGARLAPAAIWAGLTQWRLQGAVLASTFVVFPVLGLGVFSVTRGWLPSGLALGLLFLCLLPSTVQSSVTFTSIAGGNVTAALCAASVSNLLGVFLTPLLTLALLPGGQAGLSWSSMQSVAFQILLPFLAGQLARPFVGAWLVRRAALTATVDRGAILLVVYTTFSAGVVSGVWRQVSPFDLSMVVALDALILAAILMATTYGARKLGFSRADETALVFCGSKKSMVTGIPMAAILFPPTAVGLIVLPMMVFQQMQLLTCAVLARHRSAAAAETAPTPAATGSRT